MVETGKQTCTVRRVLTGVLVAASVMVSVAWANELGGAKTQRYASLLSELSPPELVASLRAVPGPRSCSAAVMPLLLESVRAGDYKGRGGSFAIAAQLAACNKVAASQLLQAYAATRPDGPSLATAYLAAGGVTSAEYDELVGQWLSQLAAAGGRVMTPYTLIPFLQWAGGRCLEALTKACLRAAAQRLLPPDWSFNSAAKLAFGDLLEAPLPDLGDDTARELLRSLLNDGFPIRADVLAKLRSEQQRDLQAARTMFLQRMFGPNEEF